MSFDVDVAIIGGGPAGTGAAIWAAQSGLRVKLLERCRFPRHRPGETLHPGLEPIIQQLGVEERVFAASALRHEAVSVEWAGRRSKEAFGADYKGSWKGYQILREDFDRILIGRAEELGVEIGHPEFASKPVLLNGRVVGVHSRQGTTRAKFVIDASGSTGWLRRHLQLDLEFASPPLRAYYGYCEGEVESLTDNPSLIGDERGWTWTAQIAPGRLTWTRLAFNGHRSVRPPRCFDSFRQLGGIRGADVTWRNIHASAGPGYFIVGDAASVLDPAASHGVLRALMSGMMASHATHRILFERIYEEEVYSAYRDWISEWFHRDVRRLTDFYRQLDNMWQFQGKGQRGKALP